MSNVAGFIVQESIHADWVSCHDRREDAIAAIEEFNIREIDGYGETVRVFGAPPSKTGVA